MVLKTKVDHALPISLCLLGRRAWHSYLPEHVKKKIQDLELFLNGPNNSSVPTGGRLGLMSQGIAILAVLKQPIFVVNILSLALVFPKTDPCFLALTPIS